MRAVMDDPGNERPVDVALDEVDDDFLTDPRDELRPPRHPGTRIGNTHPGTGMIVEVSPAFGMIGLPLPVELDLDATVFVGEDLFACRTDDGGRRQSLGRRFLVRRLLILGNERDVTTDGGEGVSVRRRRLLCG